MPTSGDYFPQWQGSTNATSVTFPVFTSAGTAVYPYVPLQPVANPYDERDLRADRDLSPVEWLERQVDDVCRLARAA